MKRMSVFLLLFLWGALLLPWCVRSQEMVYSCNFDQPTDTAGWVLLNGSQPNRWTIGRDGSMTSNTLFVTNVDTLANYYVSNGYYTYSLVYAYRQVILPRGIYHVSYDWRCTGWNGWGRAGYAGSDYMRVAVVPSTVVLTQGVVGEELFAPNSLPAGSIALDGGGPLTEWDWTGSSNAEVPPIASWHTYECDVAVTDADTYMLVFSWSNNSFNASQPPAAVDNLLITRYSCPVPVGVHIEGLVDHSFDICWSDLSGGGVTEWLVELCLEPDTQGQGTMYSTNDTLISFAGLRPDTNYTVYIRPVCGEDTLDSVVWLRVHTLCELITVLPYAEDFSTIRNNHFVPCWSWLGTDISHVSRQEGRLYWAVGVVGEPEYVILRGIDTNVLSVADLQVSFRSTDNRGLEIGLMSNPIDASSFVPVPTIHLGSDQYVSEFHGQTAGANFVAFRRTTGGIYYMDDFVIDRITPCRTVYALSVGGVGAATALLTWGVYEGTRFEPDSFEVRLACVDTGDVSVVPENGCLRYMTDVPHCMMNGLESGTAYRAWVRVRCENDSLSEWQSVRFSTHPLDCLALDSSATDTIRFSTDTVRELGVPARGDYSESYCVSLYTAEELHRSGVSDGLVGMDYTYVAGSTDYTISIYVTPTNRAASLPVDVSSADLVYGPTHHNCGTTDTVHHYDFDHPFLWDGLSDIAVTTMIHHDTLYGDTTILGAYSTMAGERLTMCCWRDTLPYTPDNVFSSNVIRNCSQSVCRPTVAFYTMSCGEAEECLPPNMLVIDSVEADAVCLSWMPGYHETSWSLLYRPMSDTADDGRDTGWIVADTHVVTTHYRLDSLDPMRQYAVRVLPNCGDANVFVQAEFATLCATIATLPYVEDFEEFEASVAAGSPTEYCWYRRSEHPTYALYPCVSSNYAHGGVQSLCFASEWSYIVLPPMGISVDNLQVSFYAYGAGDYLLRIGVLTDPTDYSSFDEVARVSPINLSTWELVEVSLEEYQGQGRYIALTVPGDMRGSVYVDDLRVEYQPPCPRPRNITVTSVTNRTAILQWTGPGALVYEIEYGPTGFVQGTGIVVSDYFDSVVLAGLSVATTYDVYVRSLCATDTSNWTLVTSFTTVCGRIDSLPYTQDIRFGTIPVGGQPTCWECGAAMSIFSPSIVNRTNGMGQVVGRSLLLMNYGFPAGTYAALPPIDTTLFPIHTLQVTIKADCGYGEYTFDGGRQSSQPQNYGLIVGVSRLPNDVSSTFTPVDTLIISEVSSVYTVPLSAARGAGEYITFISFSPTPNGRNYVLLDSVAVEPAVNCQRPYNLIASAITDTSAILAWQPYGRAFGGQVEYMPHGGSLGMGTRVDVMGTTLAVTGLAPNSSYDFYVRSFCTADDTSEWCYIPVTFITQQQPATIPYNYAFDSLAEWGNWQTFSNTSVNWNCGMGGTMGNGRYIPPYMYVSADSGNTIGTHTYEVVNAVAYRDIDFGSIDTSFVLTFSAKVVGEYSGSTFYDGLAVFLADPSVMMEPSGRYYQSPWGWLYNLTLLTDIRGTTEWSDYSIRIDSVIGVRRLVFYWFNGAGSTVNGTNSFGPPAIVDNIGLNYLYDSCPPPSNIRVLSATTTTANITWNGVAEEAYRVLLLSTNNTLLRSDTIVGTGFQYITLMPGTKYNVRVSRLCHGYETAYRAAQLQTPMCDGGVSDTIGGSGNYYTHYDLPIHNSYNYSYTQQLVLASELGGAEFGGGEISSINFLYSGPRNMSAKNHCTIYMGHTTLSSFASMEDFVPPVDMQVVYMGSLNCVEGWNRIYFNHPFAYDGSSNLVVAIDDNSGMAQDEGAVYYQFCTSNTFDPMALAFYSNLDDVVCSSSTALGSFVGGRSLLSYRTVMSIDVCPTNDCPAPRLRMPRVSPDSVLLRWNSTPESVHEESGGRYLFGYRLASTNQWIVDNCVLTDTFYVIYNYFFDTDYVYHVRQYCAPELELASDGGISNWVFGSFNTGDMPCLPPLDLWVTDVTNRSARLTWSPEGNNISYRVHVWGASYDTFFVTYLAGGRVNGLSANTRYYASVEVVCEYHDSPSRWSDTVSFVTDYCPDVAGLAALEVGGNSVLLDWADEGEVERWMIEWGPVGFEEGTGVRVMADHHPFLVTGLTGETSYDIYVRSVCGADFFSDGWGFVSVTTQYSDVGSVTDDARVTLSPNPTRGGVVLALPGRCSAAVRVEVVDGLGRVRYSEVLPAGTTKATLPTSQLGQGIYIVRLAGGEFNAVKRLVVE